ncbi:MAG TPA: hypothetical protein VFO70_10980 [Chitinophagaceae bacterium]|nr:hypothetical protein [Chitinophagaceae bacterium]
MITKKKFWIRASLFNLAFVALLGLILRTKILFPIPFIDFRNMLSSHSHFAFGGWVSLILMTLLVYDVLPASAFNKKIYQVCLWSMHITSWGMALTFPFNGYALLSIIFSSAFIFATYLFSWVFIRDIFRNKPSRPVLLLCTSGLIALVLSSIGPFSLAHIMATQSGDSIRYRDSIYLFLHFQYNGFFTLTVLGLFFHKILDTVDRKQVRDFYNFSLFLCLSVIPAYFLSILWHPDNRLLVIIASIGSALILLTLAWFFKIISKLWNSSRGLHPYAQWFLFIACTAFILKMFFQMGTMVPGLDTAIYANRPVIIGFLHMVFLGFITFYILSHLVRAGFFFMESGLTRVALFILSAGILTNVTILLLQGFLILLKITSDIFEWLLWFASLLLLVGAGLLSGVASRKRV